jgi:hypothetical protein
MDPRTPSRSRLRKEQKICRTRGGEEARPRGVGGRPLALIIKLQVYRVPPVRAAPKTSMEMEGRFQGAGIEPQDFDCIVHVAVLIDAAAQLGTKPGRAALFFSGGASHARFHPIWRTILCFARAESRFQGSWDLGTLGSWVVRETKNAASEDRLTGSGNRPTNRPCRGPVPPFRDLLPQSAQGPRAACGCTPAI